MSPNSSSKESPEDDLNDELLEFHIGDYVLPPPSPPALKHNNLQELTAVSSYPRAHAPKQLSETAQTSSQRTSTSSQYHEPSGVVSSTKLSIGASPSTTKSLTSIQSLDPELAYNDPQPFKSSDISTSAKQEHLNRLKRREELANPTTKPTSDGPLGALGYNHYRSGSKEEAKLEELGHTRGLSSGSYGMTQGDSLGLESEEKGSHVSDEEDWQQMATVASYEVYDIKGRKVIAKQDDFEAAREADDKDDIENGGSKYGYTRVTLDDDVKSVTSMDENTDFLFDEDDFNRNPLSQLKATKDMLTEGQRIAYVGLCKLAMIELATELAQLRGSRKVAKSLSNSQGSLAKWAQMMMMRLYSHMDISSEGKLMGTLAFPY